MGSNIKFSLLILYHAGMVKITNLQNNLYYFCYHLIVTKIQINKTPKNFRSDKGYIFTYIFIFVIQHNLLIYNIDYN
jgi:hypothetical protein